MKITLFLKLAASIAVVLGVSPRCFPQTQNTEAANSAKQFVEDVYARYGAATDPPNLFEKNASQAFDPSLIALARADAEAAKPDVGVLDYDPICNCQDPDVTFPDFKITIRSANARHAIAITEFTIDNTPNKLVITLVRNNSSWRIFNIEDLTSPGPRTDLRTLFKNEIRELSLQKSSR